MVAERVRVVDVRDIMALSVSDGEAKNSVRWKFVMSQRHLRCQVTVLKGLSATPHSF